MRGGNMTNNIHHMMSGIDPCLLKFYSSIQSVELRKTKACLKAPVCQTDGLHCIDVDLVQR